MSELCHSNFFNQTLDTENEILHDFGPNIQQSIIQACSCCSKG
ncbi:hypothetical protein AM1_F0091 (plasmid) [Acaryochloris marina MBIC11017]|uniref:Uncharacterized protein n=1 Tax=Acaryochloris marina (strain MBIC 11017) TaxID=329726 RepID=A8ZQ72_ACAM1|nr:hypothetical protein AM1_F0091 [Acaryochloris marina MBIC11017]